MRKFALANKSRRRVITVLFLLVAIVWLLFMPSRLYRPFCEYPAFHNRLEFGPAMSEKYREVLKFAMDNSNLPYLEIGQFIWVPFFEWTGETFFWRDLNEATIIALGANHFAVKHPQSQIAYLRKRYSEKRKSNFTDKEYHTRWCAFTQAVVEPSEENP